MARNMYKYVAVLFAIVIVALLVVKLNGSGQVSQPLTTLTATVTSVATTTSVPIANLSVRNVFLAVSAPEGARAVALANGTEAWVLPASMEQGVVAVQATASGPNALIIFNSTSPTGTFAVPAGALHPNECITDSDYVCTVAYFLPASATIFKITARVGSSIISTTINLG
jgi:hypothetical protein